MTDITYSYSDVPTIKRFSQSHAFIRGLMGPFGSGKSSGCVIEIVKWGARQHTINGKRRSRFAVIRNTYRQLHDTTQRTMFEWLPPPDFGTYRKGEDTFLVDGLDDDLEIEILFRALDRPEHVANLLSLELTGAWVNEAREVPWAIIKALQGRVGRYPAVKDGGSVDPGIIMDTNPPDDESDWYRVFEMERPANAELFRQPSGRSELAENRKFLPPDYYDNLAIGADEEFIKVYIDGEYGYVKEGKPVYPEYIDSAHCMEIEAVQKVKIKRGWDFGLTPACVFTQLTPEGRLIVLDELTAEDVGIERFADTVLIHCGEHYDGFEFEDYGDPAGEQRSQTDEKTCFEILHGKGIKISAGEQTLSMRLESVKKGLNTFLKGKPQLIIDPKCRKLRRGFQGRYQYKKLKISGAQERFHETPDKNEWSHPHDALQYVATKVFGNAVRSKAERRSTRKAPKWGGSVV